MSLDTDTEEWESAEIEQPLQESLIEFLRDNPDKAFNVRELADEVMSTTWSEAHEREREIQRIGEEQYYDELDEEEERSLASTLADKQATTVVSSQLEQLVMDGLVEQRRIPESQHSIPYEDFGSAKYYTNSESK